jgi:Ca2+-binding EF-hand superfamily protein
METLLRDMGMPYDEEELEAFMKHSDANRDGKIDYNEVQCCFVSNLGESPKFACRNMNCKHVFFQA